MRNARACARALSRKAGTAPRRATRPVKPFINPLRPRQGHPPAPGVRRVLLVGNPNQVAVGYISPSIITRPGAWPVRVSTPTTCRSVTLFTATVPGRFAFAARATRAIRRVPSLPSGGEKT